MADKVDRAIVLVGNGCEHDADLVDSVIVVFLDAVAFDEGIDRDQVDVQFSDNFYELVIQSSNGPNAVRGGLQQFQAFGCAVIKPSSDVGWGHAVVQHGGADAAFDFVEIVLKADDEYVAADMYMLASEVPAGRGGEELRIADGRFASAATGDQTGDELAAEGDA